MKAAVVIPAYNEAATIRDVVIRARAQLDCVIVVDDGSSDGTAAQLAGLDVVLLRNAQNRGKADSLWRGLQHALESGFDAVITLDGDGQHQPEDIPRVLAAARAQPGHIIIASRLQHREHAPPLRLFANRMANFWVSWAAGYFIPDSQSGFRLYPAQVLRRVRVHHARRHSFVFESEILVDAAWRGARSVPVPIKSLYFQATRSSHYKAGRDTLAIARMVAWRLFLRGLNLVGLLRVLGTLLRPPAATPLKKDA
ncbi:MAG: glycosyltransferase family 2 protein [Nevskiales bacterium]